MKAILGKKVGMTQVYDESGRLVPVTVIEAGPCVVVAKRTAEKDGYEAVQVGYGQIRPKLVNKPRAGTFQAVGQAPLRYLREFRGAEASALEVGHEIRVEVFEAGQRVDVIGTSKGKGFQGGMKRHNFNGGPASHGSMSHRRPASGGATDPARVFPGTLKPGHMGHARVTTLGLRVVRVDAERNVILVRGSVPGPNQSLVTVRASVKKG